MNNETEIHNLIQQGIFTTSMNRKVCWENGYKKGKEEERKDFIIFLEELLKPYQSKTRGQMIRNRLNEYKKEIKGDIKISP